MSALWVWRHLGVELPDDWEMLQFGRETEKGRCAFADRYGFRLEMNWRVVDGPPDYDRMFADYASRLEVDQKADGIERARSAGWPGLAATVDGLRTTRFGRFCREESCLVEMVFPWRAERDREIERRILRSFHEVPEEDGRRRWRAFGMDLRAPAEAELADCHVEPASVKLVFRRSGLSLRTEEFARLGMVQDWLKGDIDDWQQVRVPAETRIEDQHWLDRRGHRVSEMIGIARGGMLARLLMRRFTYRSATWICPADGRLYFVATTAPRAEAEVEESPAGRILSCCGPMEAG